jgi:hypothetical protein
MGGASNRLGTLPYVGSSLQLFFDHQSKMCLPTLL